MRTNLPVTGEEHRLRDDATLMSTTDLESRITYCNAAFIEASGFDRQELMGQPHNLVRHPDMPAEAFADMWRTLRDGASWTALVKNRRRNGDHYWVRANATPVYRNGSLAGYMSVRTTPTRAEVDVADALYRRMREGRARGLRLRRGVLMRSGWMAWTSLPRWLPVAWRIDAALALFAGVGVALAALLGLGASAVAELAAAMALCGAGLSAALRRQVARPLQRVLRQAQAVAAGRSAQEAGLERIDEIGLLLRAVNQAGLNLRSLVDDVGVQVSGLKTASGEIAQGNSDLSVRTEQAASSLQQTAASMEEMAATLDHNAATARQTTAIAADARGAAGGGRDAVAQVVDTMRLISDSSRRIGEIIGVIDGIAFQTAILALNAAVEAARAGPQGRGFAVVAEEVGMLARRSADAAREIKLLIADSVEKVERGAQVADAAGTSISALVEQVGRVSELVAEISGSTIEQSTGIAQVNIAVSQLDRATQQNAALVEQSAAASESMKMQTVRLAEALGVYR